MVTGDARARSGPGRLQMARRVRKGYVRHGGREEGNWRYWGEHNGKQVMITPRKKATRAEERCLAQGAVLLDGKPKVGFR
jgi:hypothetical protein